MGELERTWPRGRADDDFMVGENTQPGRDLWSTQAGRLSKVIIGNPCEPGFFVG